MSLTSYPTARQVRFAYLVTALGGLLFTIDLPLLRLSQAEPWTMVFARGSFLFIAISFAWLISRRRGEAAPFIAGKAGLLVALTSTIGNIAYISAIMQTNAANVVFIIALTPVIAALLSPAVLGARIHSSTSFAVYFAFFGVGIIAWDGMSAASPWASLLALLSAFCSATAFTVVRATGRKIATSLALGNLASAIVALVFFGASVPALLVSGALGIPAWVWLGLNGLIAIPLATVMLASGPRYLPTADVSMFFMLETVLTPIWIWMIFSEVPSSAVLIGGGIVITTLIIHSWWRVGSVRMPGARETVHQES